MKPRVRYLTRSTSQLKCTIELDEATELLFKATTNNTGNGNWTSLKVRINLFEGGGEIADQYDKQDMAYISMPVKVPSAGVFSVVATSENYHATAESVTIEHPVFGPL